MPYFLEPAMTTLHDAEAPATVSSKGQIVIPSVIRRRLNLVQGSVVRFLADGDTVRLLAEAGDVRRLKGRLALPKEKVSIDAMNAAIAMRRADAAAAIPATPPTKSRRDRP